MDTTKIILKRSVKSSKFGLTFPNKTPLDFFKTREGFVFVEHPTTKNVYIKVSLKNIV